ncbi:hypothetical protein DC366_15895 [Pelagivirga sediminicola]|uniref:Uncharacterized protein n=2 Tax=Rhodobacterales TaxID=204455 RepID=A0A2T7G3R0_9RHOB|nr:hypothetical protein [Pelagivirga sediminicola]PVA09040.1 hypothetical protein DC366_15895 [Pelagivirga sediminicola]
MMQTDPFEHIARKLAALAAKPDTSFALRRYLQSSADRDIVDVMNEIDCLARILAEHAPEGREP